MKIMYTMLVCILFFSSCENSVERELEIHSKILERDLLKKWDRMGEDTVLIKDLFASELTEERVVSFFNKSNIYSNPSVQMKENHFQKYGTQSVYKLAVLNFLISYCDALKESNCNYFNNILVSPIPYTQDAVSESENTLHVLIRSELKKEHKHIPYVILKKNNSFSTSLDTILYDFNYNSFPIKFVSRTNAEFLIEGDAYIYNCKFNEWLNYSFSTTYN